MWQIKVTATLYNEIPVYEMFCSISDYILLHDDMVIASHLAHIHFDIYSKIQFRYIFFFDDYCLLFISQLEANFCVSLFTAATHFISELVDQKWSKASVNFFSPNVLSLIARIEKLSYWVASVILQQFVFLSHHL